jgi:hypothetical protein
MADDRQIASFLRAVRLVEGWLARNFSGTGQAAAVTRMAEALKLYIRQSKRYALGPRVDGAELDRRIAKIDRAYYALWESRFRG